MKKVTQSYTEETQSYTEKKIKTLWDFMIPLCNQV
jgi:hypothetical protein